MAHTPSTIEHNAPGWLLLNVESIHLTDEQFYRLCQDNPDLRFELTVQNERLASVGAARNAGTISRPLAARHYMRFRRGVCLERQLFIPFCADCLPALRCAWCAR